MANISRHENSPVATATTPTRDSEAARLDEAIRRGDTVVRYRGFRIRVGGDDRTRQFTVGPFQSPDYEEAMNFIDEVEGDPELGREVMQFVDELLDKLTRIRAGLDRAETVA